jgi:hypothetical protein
VVELVGANAFRLSDPGLLGGDNLLVLSRDQSVVVTENDTVAVSGVVQRFDMAQLEGELGYDLQDDLFGDASGQPVLIAETVAAEAGTTMGLVSLDQIVQNPEAFAGQVISVSGQIDSQVGEPDAAQPNAFTISDPDLLDLGELLVLGANAQAFTNVDRGWFDEGADDVRLLIRGRVQTFTAEDGQDYGVDVTGEEFAQFEDRPALVAEEVLRVLVPSQLEGEAAVAYAGQRLAVLGTMGERIDQRVFTLEGTPGLVDGGSLLVVNAIGLEGAAAGALAGTGAMTNTEAVTESEMTEAEATPFVEQAPGVEELFEGGVEL